MSTRPISLVAGSGAAKVAHDAMRQSSLDRFAHLSRTLRVASSSPLVISRGGPIRGGARASEDGGSTVHGSSNRVQRRYYGSQPLPKGLQEVKSASNNGSRGYSGSSSDNFRRLKGGALSVTATAIVAAGLEWSKDEPERRCARARSSIVHSRRDAEESVSGSGSSHSASQVSRQSSSDSQPSFAMKSVSTAAACAGTGLAAAAAAAAVMTAVGKNGNARAGQGLGGGKSDRSGLYGDIDEECADERGEGVQGIARVQEDIERLRGIARVQEDIGRLRRGNGRDRGKAAASAHAEVAHALDHELPGASFADAYLLDGSENPVGKGHNSTVFECVDRFTGQPVAVKKISRTQTSRREVMEEVRMLRVAGRHPNVVTLRAFFEDKDAYYIVMELCKGGELYHHLADKGRYSEGQAARIMAEIAAAVGFLHNHGIIHFDLKPENILLAVGDDSVPEVRLTDFGSAFRQYTGAINARGFTLLYGAPEVLAQENVDEKVDMWAMGVVMWVLLTGRHPFDSNFDLSEGELTRRVLEEDPNFKCRGIRHVSPEGKDLLRRLLAKDPEDRPSAGEMLSHPWFRAVMSRPKISGRPQQQARGAKSHRGAAGAMPIA